MQNYPKNSFFCIRRLKNKIFMDFEQKNDFWKKWDFSLAGPLFFKKKFSSAWKKNFFSQFWKFFIWAFIRTFKCKKIFKTRYFKLIQSHCVCVHKCNYSGKKKPPPLNNQGTIDPPPLAPSLSLPNTPIQICWKKFFFLFFCPKSDQNLQ